MFVHAGRLARTAILTLLLAAAAAAPALPLSPAASRPADVANVAAAAPRAPSAGVAVIYRIPGRPYFRVHNALLLEARPGVGLKIAHVGVWPANTRRPTVQEFWVCYQPQSAGCPTPKRTNWQLNSFHRYSNQPCPTRAGVTYCPGPFIAYRSPAGTHNGAFACWRPTGSASCSRTWPGDNRIFQSSGTLVVLHYANPTPPANAPQMNRGSYATAPGQFRFEVRAVPGPVSAQRICYLRHTC